MGDRTSVIGMSNLVNKTYVDTTKNLEEIEKDIINGNIKIKDVSPAETSYQDLMRQVDMITLPTSTRMSAKEFNPYAQPKQFEDVVSPRMNLPFKSSLNQSEHSSYIPSFEHPAQPYNSYTGPDYDYRPRQNVHSVASSMYNTQNYEQMQIEQYRRDEEKNMWLEQIDDWLYDLEQEGIDTSPIPNVNKNSTYEEVQRVYKILDRKISKNSCQTMFVEGLMTIFELLETFFDGKKSLLGFRINLEGYSGTARVKLDKLKPQTSSVAMKLVDSVGLGDGGKIIATLLPSMFLYTRLKKKQHNSDNFVPDIKYTHALEELDNF